VKAAIDSDRSVFEAEVGALRAKVGTLERAASAIALDESLLQASSDLAAALLRETELKVPFHARSLSGIFPLHLIIVVVLNLNRNLLLIPCGFLVVKSEVSDLRRSLEAMEAARHADASAAVEALATCEAALAIHTRLPQPISNTFIFWPSPNSRSVIKCSHHVKNRLALRRTLNLDVRL
jgi:hypothetical protein